MLRILTVTALLALSITAAQAEDASNASTLVSYADLDLSKPVDARTLAARLQDAATAVCLKANPENLSPMALESCVDMSVHLAMARIESDMDEAVRDKLSNVRTAMRD
jgi:UrcA family protein